MTDTKTILQDVAKMTSLDATVVAQMLERGSVLRVNLGSNKYLMSLDTTGALAIRPVEVAE